MKSTFVYLLFTALILVACTQTQQPKEITPTTDTEGSLITDIDIDTAILELADKEELIEGTEGATIPDGEETELNDDGYAGLSTQLVLPNTFGFVYYIKFANDSEPWELWCINQATDSRTRIYKGNRKIDSVAGNSSCTIVVFSMFLQSRNSHEIYRLVVGDHLSRLTNNNADDIDVSQNAGSNIVVWARVKNGKSTIRYRTYSDLNTFVETALTHSNSQVQPSIDGDGKNIALIRVSSKMIVALYNIDTQIYTIVYARSKDLENPSSGKDQVAWLQNGSPDKVKVKNLTTGNIKTVLTNNFEIEHPHLANNALWLTYGIIVNGSFDVFVKNITTGVSVQGVFATAPREHFGMFWQLPLAVVQTFDVYQDANNPSLYHADSINSLSTYTGTLKEVVENAVIELDSGIGGTIAFRAGKFNLGSNFFHIREVDNITFEGQGMGVTIVKNNSYAAADTEVFNFGDSNNITIRNLTIKARGSARSTSDAIDNDAGSNWLVENVEIAASRSRGLVFDGKDLGKVANNNIIRNCIINGVKRHGVEFIASSNNRIENCEITNVGGRGISIVKSSPSAGQPNKKSTFNVIRNNTISNPTDDAIRVNGSKRNTIQGNTLENGLNDGIEIGTTHGISCNNNIVRDNTVTGNARYGLSISNSECEKTVVGNNNNFTGNTLGEINDLGTGTIFE